jgi:hypothetical protein
MRDEKSDAGRPEKQLIYLCGLTSLVAIYLPEMSNICPVRVSNREI